MDPIGRAISDFDIYDLVFSRLRKEPQVDTNIVLVNIGNLDRNGIGREIRIIKNYKPKIIGLDVFFWKEKGAAQDTLLSDALSEYSNFVLVSKLDRYNSSLDIYDTLLHSAPIFSRNKATGYANYPEDDKGSFRTIRNFSPKASYKNSTEYAFPVKIVNMIDSNKVKSLLSRNNEREIINYRGNFNKFYFLDTYDILDETARLNLLKDKIVLLGYMGVNLNITTLEDIFFTPMNERYAGRAFPDMYGIVINANIISMLLNQDYIDKMPYWLSIVLAVILCFWCVEGLLLIKRKYKDWFGAAFRFFIFLLTLIDLDLGVYIFNYFNYKINLTLMLAAIVLTPSGLDLYKSFIEKKLFKEEKSSAKISQVGSIRVPDSVP